MYRVRKQVYCEDCFNHNITGKEVNVAILDTGIAAHPDFSGRILGFKDFVSGKTGIYDDSGHGTHVAGCIGGNGSISAGEYRGIAPESCFIVGKVLDRTGDGSVETMKKGIDWVLQNQEQYKIRILNISVGIGKIEEEHKMRELLDMIDEAWNRGMVVICAAGNNGPAAKTLSPLGNSKKVITVGCHDGDFLGNRSNLCENYSGRGPSPYELKKPDIVAPGTDIISCNAKIKRLGNSYKNGYIKKSGTSMSTPIVSGAAALLLQKFPELTNDHIKRKIIYSATDLKEPWVKQGWGMLHIQRMLE